jgi:hypothetical protein
MRPRALARSLAAEGFVGVSIGTVLHPADPTLEAGVLSGIARVRLEQRQRSAAAFAGIRSTAQHRLTVGVLL